MVAVPSEGPSGDDVDLIKSAQRTLSHIRPTSAAASTSRIGPEWLAKVIQSPASQAPL